MLRILLTFTLSFGGAVAFASETANPIVTMTLSDVHWDATPEGVAFAALEGDRFTGQYMALVRLPAGIKSPVHTKSANMFGVMIAGEMAHYPKGLAAHDRKVVGAGGFYKIPANVAHVSECVSANECIAFLFQDGAFDFVPVAN